MSRSILTLNQTKKYLAIKASNIDYDDLLLEWIDLQSGKMEDRVGLKFAPQPFEVIVDGTGESFIRPLYLPVLRLVGENETTRLSNLQVRDDVEDAWADLLDNEDLISVLPGLNNGFGLLDAETFPRGDGNIRINYYAGFDPIPAELIEQCYQRVQVMWNESKQGSNELGHQSMAVSQGQGTGNITTLDMEKRWDTVLDKYRKKKPSVASIYL